MPISTWQESSSKSCPRVNGTFGQGSLTGRLYSTSGYLRRDTQRQRASRGFESQGIRTGYNQKRIGRNSCAMKSLSTNVSLPHVSWPSVHIQQLVFKVNTSKRLFPHTIPRSGLRETNGGGLTCPCDNLVHLIPCPAWRLLKTLTTQSQGEGSASRAITEKKSDAQTYPAYTLRTNSLCGLCC